MITTPKVTLLTHTPDPEKIVAAAAKLCYSSSGIDNILDNLSPEKTTSFVNMLSDLGHESPIEHISFTFGIEGVSRALTHQLVRHRIASYSQKSQRYVSEGDFEYVIPPEIADDENAKIEFLKAMEQCQSHYDNLVGILTEKHTKAFLDEGKDEKEAKRLANKKACEDARFVLPNACETKIIVTINARSLLNFFAHRLCNRAQWEIREVAFLMYKEVFALAPSIFKNAGPSCVFKPCPEGKMTCGKASEMKKIYNEIRNLK